MKAIKYDLENKKLNNDLREFLNLNKFKYDYIKDYKQQIRVVLYLENYNTFNIEEFKTFVSNKRKKEQEVSDILDGLINW